MRRARSHHKRLEQLPQMWQNSPRQRVRREAGRFAEVHHRPAGAELEKDREAELMADSLLDFAPIDRDSLVDSLRSAMDRFFDPKFCKVDYITVADMAANVAGGLYFLILGGDEPKLSEEELRQWADHEDAFAAMLYCDVQCWWPLREDSQKVAWEICNTLAETYCTFFKTERWC